MSNLNDLATFKVDVPNVELLINADDVVDSMTPLELIRFVTELDSSCGEWEVTLLLYNYFKSQYDLAVKSDSVPHLLAMSEADLIVELERQQRDRDDYEIDLGVQDRLR